MKLEWQILAAVALDLLLGDPRWLPHPVRGIGWLAQRLEPVTRKLLWPRLAGIVTALTVIGVAGLCAYGLIALGKRLHPLAGDVVSILIIWTTIAARDLARHSTAVYRALAAGDLAEARKRLSMMVGRDTERLDEPEVARAAVESVAESIVDGVTAPLFFAVVAGPVGAMVYRAINTLDSTFGYKDERYLKFGWASARIDDAANFIPARLTAPLVAVAAALLRERPAASLQILWRDARNHASPNAGFAEAAMAGALGVQLGGLNYYAGEPEPKPTIGDHVEPLARGHIPRANALMFATTVLFLTMCLAARVGLEHWSNGVMR
ncbi:MAG: cobalamin biosynthesis protein CobD [Planctomycetes bacterium]|nr:cobalamin biosynthesis protein CobD [Planctomycetota bacterium]